jgi:site-specific recombinase XerD
MATTTVIPGEDLRDLHRSWSLSLQAANKAPRTITTYSDSLAKLIDFLVSVGAPTNITRLTREHIELFEVDLQGRCKPASVSVRHRALQQFFRWALEEREITESPMANMRPPAIPEQAVPVPAEDDLRKLLKACSGDTFEQKRDNALIRFMIDTGVRASEAINLTVEDVDLVDKVAYVVGKGRRPRAVPFEVKTAQAIDRYLRLRQRHPHASLPAMWIGSKGRLTDSGLRQLVERRCDQAGIARLHPHVFRHHFAHSYLADGGQENDLMQIVGWRSRSMVARYAASTAGERARANYRKHSPGNRL